MTAEEQENNPPKKSERFTRSELGVVIIVLIIVAVIAGAVLWASYERYTNNHTFVEKDAQEMVLDVEQMPQGWVYRGSDQYPSSLSNVTDTAQMLFSYSSKISGNAAMQSSVMVFDSVSSANWMFSETFSGRLGPDQELKDHQGVGYRSKLLYDPTGPAIHPYTKTLVFTYGNVYAELTLVYDDLFEMSDSELAKLGKKMVENMR